MTGPRYLAVLDRCPRCAQRMTNPDDDGEAWYLVIACSQCLLCTDCCGHDDDEPRAHAALTQGGTP